MADELNRLKDLLNNAAQNQALLGLVRKQVAKVNDAVAELNTMLAPGYVPVTKQPKKKVEPQIDEATGVKRGAGRPKSKKKADEAVAENA